MGIRLGRFGKAIHRQDGHVVDNNDVVSGIVLLRKGAEDHSRHSKAELKGVAAETDVQIQTVAIDAV